MLMICQQKLGRMTTVRILQGGIHTVILAEFQNPAHGKTAHPSSNAYHTRYPCSQLRNGNLAAHAEIRLMLLGSPPDMVHGTALRKTKSSTPLTWVRRYSIHPQSGIHPCYSGLQVQDTANSPTSAALPQAGPVSKHIQL